jgi:hypothetical protein
MTELKDPYTGELFVPKRSNQKFASRSNQVKFNNERQRIDRNAKGRIQKLLDKNFKILQSLLKDQETVNATRDSLEKVGYSFTYYTHTILNNQRQTPVIFDFIVETIGSNDFKIYRDV